MGPPAIPSTPSWLDTLFQQAIVGTSQLASGAALGTTGITGYARTSDFFKYAGSASLGSQGGTFVAYNDDTSGTDPIADAILMIAVQHSGGTGLTTLGTQIDINAATQADISPNAQNVSETIGALITSGAYSALAAAKPSAAINIAYGGFKTFRKGIVVSATSLDPTVGCGGSCGIFADLPGGGNSGHAATIRWLNSTPAVDSEVWGDANGFNINSAAKIVGAATFNNQIIPAYGTPTIASGACGATSNGTLGAGSTNQAGLLQIGSATTTTCTVSFSTTLAAAPLACVLFPANAAAAATGTTVARVSSISTSSWVLTGSALANANYYYHCI